MCSLFFIFYFPSRKKKKKIRRVGDNLSTNKNPLPPKRIGLLDGKKESEYFWRYYFGGRGKSINAPWPPIYAQLVSVISGFFFPFLLGRSLSCAQRDLLYIQDMLFTLELSIDLRRERKKGVSLAPLFPHLSLFPYIEGFV